MLVGHSIAGAELSAVGTLHPDRIAGLVYLEAGYPYAFDNGRGPTMKEFYAIQLPEFPTPGNSDLVSFRALQTWYAGVDGYRIPDDEFRQLWDSSLDGRVGKPRDAAGMKTVMTVLMDPKKFADFPAVPALVIFALPHVGEAWLTNATDPSAREAANVYFRNVDALTEKQATALEEGVPGVRVVRLRGHHYIFISNETDVLGEMHAFLLGLK